MTRRQWLPVAAGVLLLGLLAWGVTVLLDRLTRPAPPPTAVVSRTTAAETPHIAATLFYAAPDGGGLIPVQRDVALARFDELNR